MIEIDLHGQRHDSVREKLESDIILEYNKGNFPIRIITGNSLVKNTPQGGGGGMGTNIIAPTNVMANNKTENNTFTESGIRNNDSTLMEANRRVYS